MEFPAIFQLSQIFGMIRVLKFSERKTTDYSAQYLFWVFFCRQISYNRTFHDKPNKNPPMENSPGILSQTKRPQFAYNVKQSGFPSITLQPRRCRLGPSLLNMQHQTASLQVLLCVFQFWQVTEITRKNTRLQCPHIQHPNNEKFKIFQ